jgi:hypothetical protein
MGIFRDPAANTSAVLATEGERSRISVGFTFTRSCPFTARWQFALNPAKQGEDDTDAVMRGETVSWNLSIQMAVVVVLSIADGVLTYLAVKRVKRPEFERNRLQKKLWNRFGLEIGSIFGAFVSILFYSLLMYHGVIRAGLGSL